ncbi:VTT domain-containing protein [Candidatus Uhrbacteria bacterium]|nr:VTT domain-containing protein [Candidatus Uhrbacteria bacterium]
MVRIHVPEPCTSRLSQAVFAFYTHNTPKISELGTLVSLMSQLGVRSKLVALVLIALVALALLYSSSFHSAFLSLISHIQNFSTIHPWLAMVIFIFVAAASAMFSLFSGAPLIPIGVSLWGSVLTLILLLTGWIIGGMGAYVLGRYGAYPFIKRFLPEKKITKYRNHIPPHTEFMMIFLFRLITPAEITGYLLGIMKYPFGRYTLITLLSEIPFAILAIYMSEAFVLKQELTFWVLGGLALFFFFLLSYLFHKKLKRR